MNQPPAWMLYGTNGYTGRLIAHEAVRRGMKPILAGRNAHRIEALAAELDCPSRVFALDELDQIAQGLAGCRAVLHCAGPFSTTAEPMMDACLQAGVDYLDITGEIAVIEAAAARHDRAVAAGVTLIPAVGFDVVPSDCLAAMLARRLPRATRLQLAFTGTDTISPGSAKTILEALPRGGRVRLDGRITKVPAAWKSMEIPFRTGPRWAVTVPWGDVAAAWHSTGIRNIEIYLAMSPWQIRFLRCFRFLLPGLRFSLPQGFVRWCIRKFITGPSADQRRSSHGSFWGRAADAEGNSVEATLETLGGYQLTVATALASLEKLLAGEAPSGFATPSKAFGAEFILTIPGTDFRWEAGK